ncbi:cytochrome P450 [Pendulispora albinea]|uniref:Cytochrome P450 n=1 Tax=Pendulispora albinea TaxID=2741071 RepID=A0ABZ2LN44_9BACT
MILNDVDPFAREILDDPYPFYARVREASPCLFIERYSYYMVARYDDVVAAAKNHAVFSSTGGVGLEWNQRPMMPMYDPPEHTRLRRLVAKYFAPRAVDVLADRIAMFAEKALDGLLEAGRGDLVADVAEPLALGVIADVMGVPDADRGSFRKWADNVMADLSQGLSPEAAARAEASRKEFIAYLKALAQERRVRPRPGATDVITMLVAANQAEALTPFEVTAFCVLLLVAGFEPAVNGIANTALAFLEHPDEARKVARNPALLPSAIEEALRYDTPVQAFFRNTLSDTEISGVRVPKGSKVMIHFASANRDPQRFQDADRFRVDRNRDPDGGAVSFGAGVHYCLGAPLARLQLNTLAPLVLRRISGAHLDGPLERASTLLFRGLRHLPVAVSRRSASF